jgi:hypothetical protein
MEKQKQIEEMAFTDVDILANDINQHCADLAETYCGGINCLSCLAHALTEKGYRKASEVAEKIFAEIDEELGGLMNTYHKSQRFSDADVIRYARCLIAELKKKYTEGGNERV